MYQPLKAKQEVVMKRLLFFMLIISGLTHLLAGSNMIQIVGQPAPLKVFFLSDSSNYVSDANGTFHVDKAPGEYEVRITDHAGNIYRKKIKIPAANGNLSIVLTDAEREPLMEAEEKSDIYGGASGGQRVLRKKQIGVFGRLGYGTAGNAAPNGQPYHDTYYKHYGTNPFEDTEDDRFSTFGLDVDKASFTRARNYLRDGNLPPQEAIRVEEFINYFKLNYAPPTDAAFAVHVDGATSRFGKNKYLLRIGIRGKDISVSERKDAILTFVIDVSGSMGWDNRLELVKRALHVLVDNLREGDRIAIAVYGTNGRAVLNHTPVENREKIRAAINALQTEGATNAEEGIRIGYRMAERAFRKGAVNRIILCSDGVANIGNTGHEQILKTIETHVEKGITLSTFGFGMDNYNDVLMEQLADKGNGNYGYIDSYSQAVRTFKEELTGVLQVIAKDVKAQIEFNPEVVERYRLLGYENRDIADSLFRDDKTDGGELGAGHSMTALYELKLKKGAHGKLGTLNLRFKQPDGKTAEEIRRELAFENINNNFEHADADLRFIAAVAEFAEILRGSHWAKDGNLKAVRETVVQAFKGREKTQDYFDLLDMIKLARQIRSRDNS